MHTCCKTYWNIPFAHRQSSHPGHCAFIHGHNWTMSFTFGCKHLDEHGFVIDFGELHFIRDWIDEKLDHACLFNTNDPLKDQIIAAAPEAFKVYELDNCSSEGIAEHLFEIFNPLVQKATEGRAFITQIDIQEDPKNAARYIP